MVNILLSGANGKMGRVIAQSVLERTDCTIVAGIDRNQTLYDTFPVYASVDKFDGQADVVIDFSHPSILPSLLEFGLQRQIPLILCTTGYTATQIDTITHYAKQVPIFFSFNMSLGVNLLASLAKKAALILGDQFDIEIIEKHHNQKIDAPSGTALILADGINSVLLEKKSYQYDRHAKRNKRSSSEIGIHAVRGGTIVGEHEVIFAGHDEVITLTHQAMSKQVFATGAIHAALFMKQKTVGLYDMSALASSAE